MSSRMARSVRERPAVLPRHRSRCVVRSPRTGFAAERLLRRASARRLHCLPVGPVRAVFDIPEFLGGQEVVEVQALVAEVGRKRAGPPPLPAERPGRLPSAPEHRAAAVGDDPFDHLLRLRVPVVKARGEVREIADDQMLFTGGQHGSLRSCGMWYEAIAVRAGVKSVLKCAVVVGYGAERSYRGHTSDSVVLVMRRSGAHHRAAHSGSAGTAMTASCRAIGRR